MYDDPVNFDRAYYERYYYDTRTAVTTRAEMRARARLIAAYADHVGCPVRRIADIGCGTGMLRATLLRALPRASYTGVERSAYLCKRYGWRPGSVDTFRSARPFDLVICYDVLQYLDERAATRAIANLARLCRGVLYFGVLTRGDWLRNCDRERTDSAVLLRDAEWYRARLAKHFRQAGAGFWLRRGAPLVTWDLDMAQ